MADQSSPWQELPDSLLFHIFSYLNAQELTKAAQTCHCWCRVAYDEFLWKELFYTDWKISRDIPRAPGKVSWHQEYKRLKYHTPLEETEVLTEHSNQVLHVCFSHSGNMFATSSKDGFIKVWNADYPATVRFSTDMKIYRWKYTQYSQFNESDCLLLVSGVLQGLNSTLGEIAVFSVEDEFLLQCKVLNKPYDIFGTWYNDTYLLSGDLKWLGHLVSTSMLWLYYAFQETDSANTSVMSKFYKFYNRNASSIRTIMVANCATSVDDDRWQEEAAAKKAAEQEKMLAHQMESVSNVRGNPLSHKILGAQERTWPRISNGDAQGVSEASPVRHPYNNNLNNNPYSELLATIENIDRPITYNQDYRLVETEHDIDGLHELSDYSILLEDDWKDEKFQSSDSDSDDNEVEMTNSLKSRTLHNFDEGHSSEGPMEIVLDSREKYLIFTTGSKTYTPHQIGFKRIKPLKINSRINLNLSEQLAEYQERKASPNVVPNYLDYESVKNLFDKVDHLIDLHGHIVGMALSPDHRYLYVNKRPWPQNYVIDNPMSPPPIAQEIDIHVIDLVTLKEVGTMLRSHKAYTPNDECFFIFLDVSNEYVASGAEDKHGYLWDRHYGICLARFPHSDVVNSVAFNPVNSEMLITASDDYTLKIWRSHSQVKEINKKRQQTTE